jgi:outer membrane cobalamin receptor
MLFKHGYTLLCCFLFSTSLLAQDLDSLLNLNAFTEESDLQKILNKNVAVSAQKLSARETPSIVSIITAEEIGNSGARDITDILRLVPGFDIAQDLQFVQGIGIRGNWGNEGKILVLMDGQPFNDLLYQSVAVGNRFPVDAIERIEIIRGPGSAIYGGSAEYGVINIITKAAESLNGVAVYGTGGAHSNAVGRSNAGAMVASKGKSLSWDASFFAGQGIVSNAKYQDLYRDSAVQNLAKTTNSDPLNINVGLQYKGLSVRTMYDVFKTSDPFLFISNKNFYSDVSYLWEVNKKFTLTPQLKYYHQVPWTWGNRRTGEDYFHTRAERMLFQVTGNYTWSRKVNLLFGALQFDDKGTDLLKDGGFRGANTLRLSNYAVFAQALLKHRLFNSTIGFRYEKNNRYGAAFVPRLAFTKKIENFHFKVLYSQAFRAPSIENINIARYGKVKPERSDVFELELGYQFTPEMLLAVNAFSISTKNILTYGTNGATGSDFSEWYENATKMGTRGVELVYTVRKKAWYAMLTYSFSSALKGDSTIATYQLSQTSKQYVAMLAHKATLNVNVNVSSNVTLNPTIIYGGKRYGYTSVDEEGNPVSKQIDPYLLTNVFLSYKNIVPGLNAGVGIYDLLNQHPVIPQAYNGGYGPIPGRSREYVVKLYYQLNFKNQ